MLMITKEGQVSHPAIMIAIRPAIERGPMTTVAGIIVHQTDGSTAASSLQSYLAKNAAGAHFLIDKDGTIYQTASVYQKTHHVGKLRARCLIEKRCTPVELKVLKKFNPTKENAMEAVKLVPSRFPNNQDSFGIELVGRAFAAQPEKAVHRVYEAVTEQQNASLKWLIGELESTFRIPVSEVFRHPTVSFKNVTEAATAAW